jgi:L-lactate dehydrogenase complex protein LldG
MNSKQSILKALRNETLPEAAAPELVGNWTTYADPLAQFKSVLETIGGRCHLVSNISEINDRLAATPELASAKEVVSLVPGAGQPNVDLAVIDDPHQLHGVDLAILPGEFGVAENGAIWVTSRGVRHRAIYIIVQRLVLVLPQQEIVANMHQAYARLRLGGDHWGAFLAGPSKTADIEQSLVIGAHGPRSLDVFCLAN